VKFYKNVLGHILIALFLIVIILVFLSQFIDSHSWLYYLIALPFVVIFILLYNSGNPFFQGLYGENDITDELKKLPNDFVVIHQGMDTDRGNIDKIVVGPTGVFVIEVKSHSGWITYNGIELLRNNYKLEKDFLKQTYAEAKNLSEVIKNRTGIETFVHPILVFSSRRVKISLGLKPIRGVYVIQKRWLNKLITQSNSNFLSQELEKQIISLLQP